MVVLKSQNKWSPFHPREKIMYIDRAIDLPFNCRDGMATLMAPLTTTNQELVHTLINSEDMLHIQPELYAFLV